MQANFSCRGIEMSLARLMFTARRTAVLGAGALLAVASASAQVAVSPSPLSDSGREAATYSSSNDGAIPALESSVATDPNGIPAAPAPAKPEGGGQYDNRAGRV